LSLLEESIFTIDVANADHYVSPCCDIMVHPGVSVGGDGR